MHYWPRQSECNHSHFTSLIAPGDICVNITLCFLISHWFSLIPQEYLVSVYVFFLFFCCTVLLYINFFDLKLNVGHSIYISVFMHMHPPDPLLPLTENIRSPLESCEMVEAHLHLLHFDGSMRQKNKFSKSCNLSSKSKKYIWIPEYKKLHWNILFVHSVFPISPECLIWSLFTHSDFSVIVFKCCVHKQALLLLYISVGVWVLCGLFFHQGHKKWEEGTWCVKCRDIS